MSGTETLAHTGLRSERRSYSWYQSIVLDVFTGMKRGLLRVTLPGGEVRAFGGSDSEVRATIRISDTAFFRRCVLHGDIGFGESYIAGEWETDDLTAVISWFLLNRDDVPDMSGSTRPSVRTNLLKGVNRLRHLLRANSRRGSRQNISDHYDINNEFFATFLDPGMTYSSAYFISPELSLEEAQQKKYERLCRMLRIGEGHRVLEIGCGWGGFAVHAARDTGCHVTAITISKEQYEYARQRILQEGLDDRIEVRLEDYRAVEGRFDRIVSIEMLEAVGHRYMETFFATCHELLTPEGALGLQVITCPDSRYNELRKGVDWIQKHIFPGSLLPSVGRIQRAVNNTGDMVLHDLKGMGLHYAQTLREWRKQFNHDLDRVRSLGFDDNFVRKWNYYLSYCEAAFQMQSIDVLQMIYRRPGTHSF